ncbi:hypothetical protein [Solihabitans fulvus]|uniref:hypothetical protein n=1 Tax=Solihabitans fulvus TaxID=1892852 RepID=UPI001CB76621|nr:hypothetical protein [Solihabitans fulvus]
MGSSRAVRGRLVSALAVAAVGVSFLVPALSAPTAMAAPTAPPVSVPDEAADEATAARYAHDGHKQVRLASKTSETSETLANPDGSWTLREYTHPVRVKQNDAWTPVDTTLVARPDGGIAPRASAVDVVLNPGGKASAGLPIVKAGQSDKEVGLIWPTDLPTPTLSGDTATYAEVLPGVDLKVQAVTSGYTEALVIKTPQAAKDPRLASVTFGLHTKNTTVEVAKGEGTGKPSSPTAPKDGLVVKDNSGAVLFDGNASRMWDSSGTGSDAEKQLGPGGGRREAAMGVQTGPDHVTIAPDQAFLADPTTKYPVSLDPDTWCTSCGIAHHVVVQDGFRDAHNYDATSGDLTDLKVGYENYDRAGTSRSYVEMNTQPIWDKVISSATLNTTLLHTYTCDGTNDDATELWSSWSLDGNTTWNNQPGLNYYLSANNSFNCHDAPNMTVQFDAKQVAVDAAAKHWGLSAFMLRTFKEQGRVNSWRRFGLNPYLQVSYNSYPNAPTNLTMQNGALGCVQVRVGRGCSPGPRSWRRRSPILTAATSSRCSPRMWARRGSPVATATMTGANPAGALPGRTRLPPPFSRCRRAGFPQTGPITGR